MTQVRMLLELADKGLDVDTVVFLLPPEAGVNLGAA
jgi:hypothetical protein